MEEQGTDGSETSRLDSPEDEWLPDEELGGGPSRDEAGEEPEELTMGTGEGSDGHWGAVRERLRLRSGVGRLAGALPERHTCWGGTCGSAGSGVSAGLGEEVEAEVGEEEQAEGSGVGVGLGEEVEVAEQSEVAEGVEVAEQHSTSGVPVA